MSPQMSDTQKIPELLAFYRHVLLDDVVPWWIRHCIGTPEDSLSQWPAVWIFSKLYNRIEKKAEWLQQAQAIVRVLAKLRDDGIIVGEQGPGFAEATPGKHRQTEPSLIDTAPAIAGLTEFARATNEVWAIEAALATAEGVLERLHSPFPGDAGGLPGGKIHTIPMTLSLPLWELGCYTKDDRYCEAAVRMQEEIFTRFYRKGRDLLLERIAADNNELPSPGGTVVVPGHVMRSTWSQIHVARDRHDRRLIPRACDLILRHLEAGWDSESGGLFLAIDADSGKPVASDKFLWPQVEGLYATLLAYEYTGEKWTMQWHEKLRQYCLEHFASVAEGLSPPLDQAQSVPDEVTSVMAHDPACLPRAIIHCIDTLERLTEFI
jgi:N-acylglucosamine 2-epimerase